MNKQWTFTVWYKGDGLPLVKALGSLPDEYAVEEYGVSRVEWHDCTNQQCTELDRKMIPCLGIQQAVEVLGGMPTNFPALTIVDYGAGK